MLRMKPILKVIGGLYGNQRDFLQCGTCKKEFSWRDKRTSCTCGGELFAVVPNSLLLPLRWQMWRSKYFPHRLYTWPHGGGTGTKYWKWRGRKFFIRPHKRPDWFPKEDDNE